MGRILVTGGAGFIGSHTMQALLQRGDEVVCLDSFDAYYPRLHKERNLAEVGTREGLRLVEGDIRDEALVADVFRDFEPEAVIHLAARAGVRPSIEDPAGYMSVNVSGTVNLLQAAVRAEVRKFVFASSSSVYGAAASVPFSEEQDITRPVSPYAASKVAGEALCYTMHHLYRLPIVGLRFFTVFGPRQRPDLAINKFVRLMLAGQPLPVFGDGTSSRDYTFVSDIVRGIVAALEADLTYEVVNLGNSAPVTLSELIATLESVMGCRAEIERLPDQPGDVPRTYASTAKALRLLDWQPQVSLRDGLERFVEWYRRASTGS